MEASDEDFLSTEGQFKDGDGLDDLDVEEEEALLRFSEHEDSLFDDQDGVEYVDEEGNPVEVNAGENVEVVGQIDRHTLHCVEEDDVLEVEVENDLDIFTTESSKTTKDVVPEEAEVSSSGIAASGEEEEQAEEEASKPTSSSLIIQDDEEEDEEGDTGRNRFRNERQNIITLSKPRKRAHIPDTLESVISEEEAAKATAFLSKKQEQQRNRRQFQQRHNRDMRPRQQLFQNHAPLLHPRNPHQQACRPPPHWDGAEKPKDAGRQFRNGPPQNGPHHMPPMERALPPFQYPHPLEGQEGGCPLPRKILINPHFKGPNAAAPLPPPPPLPQQGSWHEDVSIDQIGQGIPGGGALLPDPGHHSQHSWPPPAPQPLHQAPHHPQEPYYEPPPQQNYRHFHEPPRQQHFHQPPPLPHGSNLPYPPREGPPEPPIHHPHGPPPHGPPHLHSQPPPYPPSREPHFQTGNWNSPLAGPPPHSGPPGHHGGPGVHGPPGHFNSRGFPSNRDGFVPEPPYPPPQPPLPNQFGSPPPTHSHQHHHPHHHGPPPPLGLPPPNHPAFLDHHGQHHDQHPPIPPPQRYKFSDQQIPGGGPQFTDFSRTPRSGTHHTPRKGPYHHQPQIHNTVNMKNNRVLMGGGQNQAGMQKGKWIPNKSQGLKSPTWQGKPKIEPRKPPVQTGNIKEVPIVESLELVAPKVEEEDEETRELRKKIEEQRKLREEVMRRKEERRRQMAAQRLQEVQARKNSTSASGLVTIQPIETPSDVTPKPAPQIPMVKPLQQQQQQPPRAESGAPVNLQPAPNRLPVKQRLGPDVKQVPKKVLVVRKSMPATMGQQARPQEGQFPQQRSVPQQAMPLRPIPPHVVPQQRAPPRQLAPHTMQPRMPLQMRQATPNITPRQAHPGVLQQRQAPPQQRQAPPQQRPGALLQNMQSRFPPPQRHPTPFRGQQRQQLLNSNSPVLRPVQPGKPGVLRQVPVNQGPPTKAITNLVPTLPNKSHLVRTPVPVRVTGQPAANVRPMIRGVARGSPVPGRTVMPVGRRVIQVVKRAPNPESITAINNNQPAKGIAMQQQQQTQSQLQQAQRTVKMSQMTSVVISNLSASTSEVQLMKLCRTVGPVENIKLMKKDGKATVKFKQGVHADQFQKKFQRYLIFAERMVVIQVLPHFSFVLLFVLGNLLLRASQLYTRPMLC